MSPLSQLHPNCCAFMCGFEILCEGLGFQLSMGMFFSLYEMKASIKALGYLPTPISTGIKFQLIHQTTRTVRRHTFEFRAGNIVLKLI